MIMVTTRGNLEITIKRVVIRDVKMTEIKVRVMITVVIMRKDQFIELNKKLELKNHKEIIREITREIIKEIIVLLEEIVKTEEIELTMVDREITVEIEVRMLVKETTVDKIIEMINKKVVRLGNQRQSIKKKVVKDNKKEVKEDNKKEVKEDNKKEEKGKKEDNKKEEKDKREDNKREEIDKTIDLINKTEIKAPAESNNFLKIFY